MEMTLSRALRHKKRIIEKIRKLENDIQSNNSKMEGEERDADVRFSLERRKVWVDHLIDFKLRLQAATLPIQKSILELAELKSELAFIQRLPTSNGKVCNYNDTFVNYHAEITRKEVDQIIEDLQRQVDDLQTKIDTHNAITTLTVEDPVVS